MKFRQLTVVALLGSTLFATAASAQRLQISGFDSRASHLVLPQARAWHLSSAVTSGVPAYSAPTVRIDRVLARVDIIDRIATTELEIRLSNTGHMQSEGVVLLPVPSGAAVSGFDFEGSAAEPTAELLPAAEARRTYDDIVRKLRDPALLEFAGYDLLRSSVFPIPEGGRQRVKIRYTHICEVDGDRIDYVLPRSESLNAQVPWDIQVTVSGQRTVGALYSPSHELTEPERPKSSVGPTRVYLAPSAQRTPGTFRLSWLTESSIANPAVKATMFAYPDPAVGGGFFLLMAGVPAKISDAVDMPQREVTLVIDRSGSMRGGKLDQVKAGALQIIEGLQDGERFNLIDYSNQVEMFAARPVVKNAEQIRLAREYLAALVPSGGTNIRDALIEAVRQPTTKGSMPIVLFLTDGIPTVGVRSEAAISEAVRTVNAGSRRIFTIGVGEDVNAPLLDRISEDARTFTTYVDPGADVEVAIHSVFRKLHGPVLSEPTLWLVGKDGKPDTRRIRELCPTRLPDLYEGGTTVLLGQYRGEDPLHFRVQGDFLGTKREFAFQFDLDKATVKNSFVPRLWATRRIAFLAEEIRQAGAELTAAELAGGRNIMAETRNAELGEEILRLSTTYGVLSEYTSFLALEGSDLGDWSNLVADANRNLNDRAVLTRNNVGAFNQGKNFQFQKAQACLNPSNGMWNAYNERVEYASVQQVCDMAFFNRSGTWIDARLIRPEGENRQPVDHDEEVLFGSERHLDLVHCFAREGRQGALALEGRVLVEHEGKRILVRNDAHEAPLTMGPDSDLIEPYKENSQ